MGYKNFVTAADEAVQKSTATYNVNSHGDLGATYNSLSNADLPDYAHGFYMSSAHEQFTDVKYNKIEINYDKNLREIHEAVKGIPLEAYIPASAPAVDLGSAPTKIEVEVRPPKRIVEEIIEAQKQAAGREIMISQTEVQEIVIRRVRKREISVRGSKN